MSANIAAVVTKNKVTILIYWMKSDVTEALASPVILDA